MAEEIDKSKYLLDLEEDWDDEGGKAVSIDTWKRAAVFLLDHANWLYYKENFKMITPQIRPGPDASVDLLWKNNDFRLLINIPEIENEPIGFYGDNNEGKNPMKGTIEQESIQKFLATWIKLISIKF